ncbi:Growth-regulating factor [Forsythia ovata]|uniref:Growth-regulating factor n=1 Tax=Forsythia ovata TaxID=205694 RepID=A0ABD1U9R5_9LAMI
MRCGDGFRFMWKVKGDILIEKFLVRAERGRVIRRKDEWDRINIGSCGDGGSKRELGYGRCKLPFTAVQWQELEHQAMIYKYLVAGLPIPPDLVIPIRHSFEIEGNDSNDLNLPEIDFLKFGREDPKE